jgi:hypothetical protein
MSCGDSQLMRWHRLSHAYPSMEAMQTLWRAVSQFANADELQPRSSSRTNPAAYWENFLWSLRGDRHSSLRYACG